MLNQLTKRCLSDPKVNVVKIKCCTWNPALYNNFALQFLYYKNFNRLILLSSRTLLKYGLVMVTVFIFALFLHTYPFLKFWFTIWDCWQILLDTLRQWFPTFLLPIAPFRRLTNTYCPLFIFIWCLILIWSNV